ncbi:hypothetical protein MUTS16_62850 [Escherichia coli]|nr:hypothetical protein MUTS16_62850 [Escherichia coli]
MALKLRSPDIPHKSEVQGVMLYLRTANEVQQAANAIFDRVKMAWPQARVHGLLVQSMANRAGAQELRVVVEHDPVFGPLIMLGEGGVEWRPEDQAVVALPPLNMNLARYLVIQGSKVKDSCAQCATPIGCCRLEPASGAGFQLDCRLPGNSASGYSSFAGFWQ